MAVGRRLALVLGAFGGAALMPLAARADPIGIFIGNHDDGSTTSIGEYTETGTSITSLSPNLVTNIYQPGGIAISGSDLFVTDQTSGGTGLITEYTSSGTLVGSGPLVTSGVNGASLTTPLGIAVYGSNLFVANFSTNSIGKYTTSGVTVNASLISGLGGPNGIAVSANGQDLFVTNSISGTVAEYNITGIPALVGSFSVPNNPNRIAVSPNGVDLYVTSNSGGKIYDYAVSNIKSGGNASPTATWTLSGYTSAYGIALYGSDLFVSQDQGVNDVLEFTTSGVPVSTTPDPLISGLNDPYAIAVPEPVSLALLGLGGMGLLLKRRKKLSM